MVRSTVLDSIGGMMRGIAAAPGQLQQTRARELINEEAYAQRERKAQLDLMDEIEGIDNFRVDPLSTEGQLFRYNFESIAEDAPDLAISVLNFDPRFNVATDERGRKIQTQVDSFVKNEDGSYSVLVTRPDGRRVPITKGRTAQGKDVVVKLSPEEFNLIGSRRITAIRGADGVATSTRDMDLLADELIAAETTEAALNTPLADDPAAISEVALLINRATGEDLYAIARDFNVDPEAVRKNVAAANPGVTDAMSTETTSTETEAAAPAARGAFDLSTLTPGLSSTEAITDAVNNATETEFDIFQPYFSKQVEVDHVAKLKKEKKRIETRLAVPPSSTSPRGKLREEERREKAEADLAQINAYLNHVEGGDTEPPVAEIDRQGAPSASDEQGSVPGDSLNTEDQVRQAIMGAIAEPTEEQAAVIQRMLQKEGVTKQEDLRKLPPKKVYMAAWLAASRHPGTLDERLTIANKLMNFAQTGNTTVSPYDVSKLQIDKDNAELRAAEFRRNVINDYRGTLEASSAEKAKALDTLGTLRRELTDEDGNFIAPTGEATNLLTDIWNKAAIGGKEGEAFKAVAVDALVHHVAALANSGAPGLFEIGKRLQNWFNNENKLRVGVNALPGLVRVKTDGGGNVTAITFRDPDGVGETNFELSVDFLNTQYGPKAVEVLKEIGRNNRAAEARARSREKSGG